VLCSACITRNQPTLSWLHAIHSDGNSVAVAGVDATVYVYDARTWSVKSRYLTPAKYEITGVFIDEVNQHCFTAGMDNEVCVMCRVWYVYWGLAS
jgi:WD40 repeat protein